VGTILGVAIGALGLRALLAIGASKLPRLDAVSFDGRVLLFALATLVLTGLIIGLAPAVRLMRSDMKTLMNDSSRSASAGRGTARWLMAMTVAEVALAIMLVAGAGWLVRGFSNLRNTKAGFVTDNRLLFDVSFLGPRYPTPAAVQQAHVDLMTAVRSVRGVTGVGLVSAYPTRGRLEAVHQCGGSLFRHLCLLGQLAQPGAVRADPGGDPCLREGEVGVAGSMCGRDDPVFRRAVGDEHQYGNVEFLWHQWPLRLVHVSKYFGSNIVLVPAGVRPGTHRRRRLR